MTNCSFGKVEGDKIPIFDMQNIFIELRKMSVGDTVEWVFACGECGEKNTVIIDLNDFELKEDESHSPTIQLTEGLSIEMRYPQTEELKEIAGTNTHAEIYSVAAKCIDKIYMEDAVYTSEETSFEERLEFIENLTSDTFDNVRNFFETMPVMEHTIQFKCKKCGKDNYSFMNGYLDFFVCILFHESLQNYFKTNFLLMQEHKYSLTEIENWMPWERSVYISMLIQHLKKKLDKMKQG